MRPFSNADIFDDDLHCNSIWRIFPTFVITADPDWEGLEKCNWSHFVGLEILYKMCYIHNLCLTCLGSATLIKKAPKSIFWDFWHELSHDPSYLESSDWSYFVRLDPLYNLAVSFAQFLGSLKNAPSVNVKNGQKWQFFAFFGGMKPAMGKQKKTPRGIQGLNLHAKFQPSSFIGSWDPRGGTRTYIYI